MASVFRRTRLAGVPSGAVIVVKGKSRFADWTDDGGKHRAPVLKVRSGDRIVLGRSAIYYGKLKVGRQWKTVALFSDKTASERRLGDLQRDADRRDAGVITADMDHAKRSVPDHVKDYMAALRLQKLDADHLRISQWMIDRLVEWTGWTRISDISSDSIRKVLTKLDAEGKTPSYLNKFIKRAKAFVHWMDENGRLVGDPLRGLKLADEVNGKRTRGRRELTDNEVTALLETAPECRRIKYAFPLLAGIRRSEFKDLLWGDLKMNAPRPFIKLRPEQTKNKKADVLPLHPYLITLIKALPVGPDDSPVLTSVPDMKTLARDLLKAGVATLTQKRGISIGGGRYIDISNANGLRVDYHALRHTFSTNLDQAGCSWMTKLALLRHGPRGVTAGYSHVRIEELYNAVERLKAPGYSPPNANQQTAAALRKTGTDDSVRAPTGAPNDGLRLSKTDEDGAFGDGNDSAETTTCDDA